MTNKVVKMMYYKRKFRKFSKNWPVYRIVITIVNACIYTNPPLLIMNDLLYIITLYQMTLHYLFTVFISVSKLFIKLWILLAGPFVSTGAL